jgi:hypothetical protein
MNPQQAALKYLYDMPAVSHPFDRPAFQRKITPPTPPERSIDLPSFSPEARHEYDEKWRPGMEGGC